MLTGSNRYQTLVATETTEWGCVLDEVQLQSKLAGLACLVDSSFAVCMEGSIQAWDSDDAPSGRQNTNAVTCLEAQQEGGGMATERLSQWFREADHHGCQRCELSEVVRFGPAVMESMEYVFGEFDWSPSHNLSLIHI